MTKISKLLMVLAFTSCAGAQASESLDRKKDVAHYVGSAVMGYYAEQYFAQNHPSVNSVLAGAGVSFAVGFMKEVVDHAVNPGAKGSGKDLVLDAAGALTGAYFSQWMRKDRAVKVSFGANKEVQLAYQARF